MIIVKEKIIKILKKSDKALSIYELKDLLGISSIQDIKELNETLTTLENDFVVYHTNKNKYMLLEDSHLLKGIMRINKKGFGFVEVDNREEDIYVSENNLNGAIHGDIVLVEIISKKTSKDVEGRILRVVKRPVTRYVGEINFRKNNGYVTLDDKK